MNQEQLESTLDTFLKAWENKDVDAVVNLLSNSFEYFESPLDEPLITKDQVRELWAPVPQFEATVSLSFETLSIEDEFGIFRIKGVYEHTYDKDKKTTRIDRIFLLSVDNEGKMTKFIQWRESKDE